MSETNNAWVFSDWSWHPYLVMGLLETVEYKFEEISIGFYIIRGTKLIYCMPYLTNGKIKRR